jgi:hypothetical protein
MSHLKTVVIPEADHITAVSRPEFIRALRDFIAGHRAGGDADKR